MSQLSRSVRELTPQGWLRTIKLKIDKAEYNIHIDYIFVKGGKMAVEADFQAARRAVLRGEVTERVVEALGQAITGGDISEDTAILYLQGSQALLTQRIVKGENGELEEKAVRYERALTDYEVRENIFNERYRAMLRLADELERQGEGARAAELRQGADNWSRAVCMMTLF